jgi:Fur family zinc uptake transcriptional regulator
MSAGSGQSMSALEVQARIDQARRCSRERGLKWTGQRERVLRLLLARGGSAKAYDLLTDWQREQPGASAMAVYRALDCLVDLGVVHRVASGSRFLACVHPEGAHQDAVFLVCEACGSATEYAPATLEGSLAGVTQDSGFAVHHVEILGRCGGCRGAGIAHGALTAG